jgi:DNA polymerase-3 subunit gamma/tau
MSQTSYEVLARKYRPQQFDDVVGQGHVTNTLKNAIASQRVAHAYLFVGPRGVGKTTIARIFAKALNCRKGPTAEPCGECDSCREIAAGNNLDVLEIDGASNNGVDQVRELRDNAAYTPNRGPYKIYIIDEVHMLSTAAFNALLKTLEEPPPHIKFIFATTEPQKVLATIISRCQRYDLRRIPSGEIVKHLAYIAGKEGIALDSEAAIAIARGAEGGLRDAESALDQLIAFRGRQIVEADVLSVFGLVARKALDALALSLVKGDLAGVLKTIAELDAAGKDLQRLTAELLDYFRNVVILVHAGREMFGDELADAQVAALQAVKDAIDPGRIMAVVDILVELQGRMRDALTRRTLLELYLIRASRAATTVSLDEVLARIQALRSTGAAPEPAAVLTSPLRAAAPPPASPAPAPAPAPVRPPEAEAGPVDDLSRLTQNWRAFVDRVGHVAMLAKNCLLDAKPVSITHDKVVIGFDPEFASKRESMNLPRNAQAVQKALDEFLKRKVTVTFSILDAESARSLPTDHAPGAAPSSPPPQQAGRKSRREWTQDPAVKRALETFNGDIIDIRE